jgi:hypothetical protein
MAAMNLPLDAVGLLVAVFHARTDHLPFGHGCPAALGRAGSHSKPNFRAS